jgi:hypothetical protein
MMMMQYSISELAKFNPQEGHMTFVKDSPEGHIRAWAPPYNATV